MDVQNNFCDLIGAKRQILPFENHFQNLHSNTKVLLHKWILMFPNIPGISSLQNLAKWFIFYGFYKLQQKSGI
jgi:hypothetical protein